MFDRNRALELINIDETYTDIYQGYRFHIEQCGRGNFTYCLESDYPDFYWSSFDQCLEAVKEEIDFLIED